MYIEESFDAIFNMSYGVGGFGAYKAAHPLWIIGRENDGVKRAFDYKAYEFSSDRISL